MKRLTLLTAALLFSFNAHSQTRRPLARVSPYPTVTPCELARDADLYHGRTVRVVAGAYVITGNTFNLDTVGGARGRCGAEGVIRVFVRPEKSAGMGEPFDEFIRKMSLRPLEGRRATAEVEVVGEFNEGAKGLTDCFGPRFSIEARSVRRLSPATPSLLE